MTRDEAKKLAMSRDCHCVKGKDRDSNYNECVDKIFDWHESEVENLRLFGVVFSEERAEVCDCKFKKGCGLCVIGRIKISECGDYEKQT